MLKVIFVSWLQFTCRINTLQPPPETPLWHFRRKQIKSSSFFSLISTFFVSDDFLCNTGKVTQCTSVAFIMKVRSLKFLLRISTKTFL
jgi:hypothetical protein